MSGNLYDQDQHAPNSNLATIASTPSSSISGHKRTRSNSEESDRTSQKLTIAAPAKRSWTGWAEVENDPLVFTHLLQNWGVTDVRVDEVIPLETVYTKPPGSVLGLIFLSRWTAAESTDNVVQAPQELWFANQLSTFSCATLALMNIINNRSDLDLGTRLNDFKQKTFAMKPVDRGVALDSFEVVRDTHNSFARELDRLIVDLHLKEDVQAANKKRAPKKKRKKRHGARKKSAQEDEDNGFHFIAYVPQNNQVWKLDGMEVNPRLLGKTEGANEWLDTSIADIQAQMEGAEANAMEFSVMSLTHEPGVQFEDEDRRRIDRMREDWSPFIVHMLELHAQKGDIDILLG